MKIGITEQGDAGIDLTWFNKLHTVDAAIIITKKITNDFINKMIEAHNNNHKLILHCTCTGWGASPFEPNVPDYKTQLNNLQALINAGFPANQCVLRIDPIFPTKAGIKRVKDVIDYFIALNTGVNRIRISIYDEYNHVKERLRKANYNTCYDGTFYASYDQMKAVATLLSNYNNLYTFETCAEDTLCKISPETFVMQGCISSKEFEILNLALPDNLKTNGQQRRGCHCLTCKTELLTNKHRCPNQCIYCYWRD